MRHFDPASGENTMFNDACTRAIFHTGRFFVTGERRKGGRHTTRGGAASRRVSSAFPPLSSHEESTGMKDSTRASVIEHRVFSARRIKVTHGMVARKSSSETNRALSGINSIPGISILGTPMNRVGSTGKHGLSWRQQCA